jgi:hypothetical protein
MAFLYPQTIFDAIRQERQDFLYNWVEIVPGFTFSQYQNVQKIHKYYNSQYQDGNYETINGITRKKVFWNLGKRRATIASKQIDIDTKDFVLISENQVTEWNVALLEKELKAWMKQSEYGTILKQVSDELPVYGSVVLRKTKGSAELVDLRYFFCEQSAKDLKQSRYKIVKHFMSPEDMRSMAQWSNVQEAIDRFAMQSFKSYENAGQLNIQHGTPYVEVYERYAEVPVSYIRNEGCLSGRGNDDQTFTYARFICAGVDNQVTQGAVSPAPGNPQSPYYNPGLILFMEEVDRKDDPFKEVHFRKTKGRWQGIGIIEDTFEDQRMVNKTKDQEDKAAELAALILFQTATDMVARNVLTDVDNGEILKATAPINRLDNQNHSLPEMQAISTAYENHADLETFSADLLGGKQTPAAATLGAVKAQAASSSSVFDYKRDAYALFLDDFITDLVMPELEKNITARHELRFQGDLMEMQKIRERAVDGYMRTQILQSGGIPTQEEYDATKAKYIRMYVRSSSKMWIDVERDFFRNIRYELSLEVNGVTNDAQGWLSNLSAVFKLISGSPLIIENPLLKRLLYKMLSAMGMSTAELENAQDEVSQEMMENMIRLGIKRQFRQNMDFKDMPPAGQQGMAAEAGIQIPQSAPTPQSVQDSQRPSQGVSN